MERSSSCHHSWQFDNITCTYVLTGDGEDRVEIPFDRMNMPGRTISNPLPSHDAYMGILPSRGIRNLQMRSIRNARPQE